MYMEPFVILFKEFLNRWHYYQFLTLLHACRLASPNPRTYIGSGKVAEIKTAIHALDVETVIFDDELSAG